MVCSSRRPNEVGLAASIPERRHARDADRRADGAEAERAPERVAITTPRCGARAFGEEPLRMRSAEASGASAGAAPRGPLPKRADGGTALLQSMPALARHEAEPVAHDQRPPGAMRDTALRLAAAPARRCAGPCRTRRASVQRPSEGSTVETIDEPPLGARDHLGGHHQHVAGAQRDGRAIERAADHRRQVVARAARWATPASPSARGAARR